ncbi:MAG: ATP-grasp domain-containing protein [Synergistaceae bacterium]|nr:ATP-grasp domain-containing protein [Synergistaceae bacterium]
MKTVLVLPGSYWQLELVCRIRETGNRVLVVDPHTDAPCVVASDGNLVADIFDSERVTEYARANKIDAVMSDQCDIAMPVIAALGEKLGLHALSRETAKLFTSKFMMREFCREHGLKFPEYRLCRTLRDVTDFLHELGRPIIIKPLDSNASHGVFRVSSDSEASAHFEETMSFSRYDKCIVAERFIEGTEFTVDGVKTPSAHYTLAISEKEHYRHNINIANQLLFSHYSNTYDYEALKRANDAFIMQSGLVFGFTHSEYKYEDGDFYLIETAARGGGNMISSLITQYLSGYDTYKYLIDCSLGNIHDEDFSVRDSFRERAAVLKFFGTPGNGGIVRNIRGLDFLEGEPDVKHFMLNFKAGDVIGECVSDSARIGFYVACSESMEKLKDVIRKVDANFRIELEEEKQI